MAKYNQVQTNFLSGEMSPKALGRVDAREYYQAAEIMENFLPIPGGGVAKRPGFVLAFDGTVSNMWDSGPIPAYTGLVCQGLFPFLRDTPSFFSDVICLFPTAVSISDQLGIFTFNHATGEIIPTTWSKAVGSSLDITTGTPFEGYNRHYQKNDTLILYHSTGAKPPLVIVRLFDNSFHIGFYHEEIVFNDDLSSPACRPKYDTFFMNFPYTPKNIDPAITLKPSGTTGTVTVSCRNASDSADVLRPASIRVGCYVKIVHATQEGVALVTAIGTNSFTAVVQSGKFSLNFGATTNTDNWSVSIWGGNIWPSCGAIFQDRMVFGGIDGQVWVSRNRNIFFFMQVKLAQDSSSDTSGINFFGQIVDTDPFDISVGDDVTSRVNWIKAERVLLIGTRDAEYLLLPGSEGFSYRSFDLRLNSRSGGLDAVVTDEGLVFLHTDSKSFYSLTYNDTADKYSNVNLSLLNDEILETSKNLSGSFQAESYSIGKQIVSLSWDVTRKTIWGVTTTGALISLTNTEKDKYAFSKHYITGRRIQRICVLPRASGNLGTVVLALITTSGGGTIFAFMPQLGTPPKLDFQAFQTIAAPLQFLPAYADLATVYFQGLAGNLTTFTVPWTSGESVDVWAGGYWRKTETNSGSVDVGAQYSQVCIGIPINATIKSVPIESRSFFGDGFPTIGRIDRLILRLFRSLYISIGNNLNQLDPVELDTTGDISFTGTTDGISLDDPHRTANQFFLASSKAGPCTIIAVGIRGQLSD